MFQEIPSNPKFLNSYSTMQIMLALRQTAYIHLYVSHKDKMFSWFSVVCFSACFNYNLQCFCTFFPQQAQTCLKYLLMKPHLDI